MTLSRQALVFGMFPTVLTLAVAAAADTLSVPSRFATVQAALTAAKDGDEVLVAPGTYTEILNLLGKTITLRSSGGSAVTTLQGSASGSIMSCTGGETEDTVVQGFTFNAGKGTFASHCTGAGTQRGFTGGAIRIVNSGLTVTDCAFVSCGNAAGGSIMSGGAIFVQDGALTIDDCSFQSNATLGSGTVYGSCIDICGAIGHIGVSDCTFNGNGRDGAFGCINGYGPDVTVSDCSFTDNSASFGGGISAFVGDGVTPDLPGPTSAIVTNCTFVGNEASFGGGVDLNATHDGTVRLLDCTFIDNHATGGGGADVSASTGDLSMPDPIAEVIDCTFIGNQATHGGGMELNVSTAGVLTVTNCLMVANRAVGIGTAVKGGGIMAVSHVPGSLDITNCTIVHGSAGFTGGGIAVTSFVSGSVAATNCIVRNNAPNQIVGSSVDAVTYCNVQGGFIGAGNINSDPLFADADGADGIIGSLDDDFRLLAGSPCIDAGDNAAVPEAITMDLDGAARFVDDPAVRDTGLGRSPLVDMGGYEFQVKRPTAPEDLDGDGDVDGFDLALLLGVWTGATSYSPCPPVQAADLDGDCRVNGFDLALLLGAWAGG